jgi:ABC-type sugar transport system ATPase subunit
MGLELRNIIFRYPYTDINILNDLSAGFNIGRFTVLYGPEGAGKTTLLKIIAGRLKPLSGDILKDGLAVTGVKLKDRAAAYCDDTFLFFKNRSVYYNLCYPLKVRKIKKMERSRRIKELTNGKEVERYLHKKIKKLNFLEKLTVALLRFSVVERDVLLLDEILKHADHKQEARELIFRHINTSDKIVILATDDEEEKTLFAGDNFYILDAGKIIKGVQNNE